MGLDISYYRNARLPSAKNLAVLASKDEDDRMEWAYENGIRHIYINPHFPGREAGLPDSEYVEVDDAEEGGFCAGSYSGYGRWRSSLASLAGSTSAFHELIHFADNEGVIGPLVSAKLAKDFADWQDRAHTFALRMNGEGDKEWFMLKYKLWREAFTVASDGGFVDFH